MDDLSVPTIDEITSRRTNVSGRVLLLSGAFAAAAGIFEWNLVALWNLEKAGVTAEQFGALPLLILAVLAAIHLANWLPDYENVKIKLQEKLGGQIRTYAEMSKTCSKNINKNFDDLKDIENKIATGELSKSQAEIDSTVFSSQLKTNTQQKHEADRLLNLIKYRRRLLISQIFWLHLYHRS